jgi:hypothetical protein
MNAGKTSSFASNHYDVGILYLENKHLNIFIAEIIKQVINKASRQAWALKR